MKKSHKTLLAVVMGTALVAGAGATVASGYERYGKGCDREHGMMKHDKGLKAVYRLDDLTDEQRDQLDDLRKEQRNAMFDVKDDMQDGRRELREAMQSGADMEMIRKLAREQGNQVETMIIQRAEARQKLAAILTDEQMKELQSMKKRSRFYHDDDYEERDDD